MVRTGDIDSQGIITPDPSDLNISGQAQGDILYFNGTNWVRLAAGTADQLLKTNGAAANPAWTDAPSPTPSFNDNYWEPDRQCCVLGFDMANSYIDKSINNNAVTLAGSFATIGNGQIAGKVSRKCYDYDGSGDYMIITNGTGLQNIEQYVIECWFYKDVTGQMTICHPNGGGSQFYMTVLDSTCQLSIQHSTGVKTISRSHGLPSSGTGAWVNWVLTYDNTPSGIITSYINGSQIGSTLATGDTGSCNITSTPIRFGTLNTGGEAWNGRIDGFRFLKNTFYTAAEVLARYNKFA
jgi:hypothetical protein